MRLESETSVRTSASGEGEIPGAIPAQEEAIARAYAHMDEVNEAHGRGEETAAERLLNDAKEGKAAKQQPSESSRKTVDFCTSRKDVAAKPAESTAPPAKRKPTAPSDHPGNVAWRKSSKAALDRLKDEVGKKRRKPNRRKARSEDMRNRALDLLGDRERRVIETGAEALDVYRNYRHLAADAHTKADRLIFETGPRWVGERIELQVVQIVRGHVSFPDWESGLMNDAWFAGLLEEFMPWELHGPWPGICEAEIDAMLDVKIDTGDGGLLPGMKRAG